MTLGPLEDSYKYLGSQGCFRVTRRCIKGGSLVQPTRAWLSEWSFYDVFLMILKENMRLANTRAQFSSLWRTDWTQMNLHLGALEAL